MLAGAGALRCLTLEPGLDRLQALGGVLVRALLGLDLQPLLLRA